MQLEKKQRKNTERVGREEGEEEKERGNKKKNEGKN